MPAYNGYPLGYQPAYYQQYQQAVAPQTVAAPQPARQMPTGNIIWVQGETGAKSYMVPPNTTVLLMDSEGDRFYLKSSDASGMPLPLRVFEHKEITAKEDKPAPDTAAFATKEEIAALRGEIEALKKTHTSGVENGGA